MPLITPLVKDEDLLADIAAANPGEGLDLWWLGQSGFLLKSAAGQVLLDPYLSDSLTRKYRDTDKPHVRMTELCVAPGKLRGIDLITSSHNHTDHLDAETLQPVLRASPGARLLIPEANRALVAERIGCPPDWPIGISDGESVDVGGLRIHAVPAAHNTIDRDEAGRCQYLGYVVQLGEVTVYHSGDTLRYQGMEDRLRPFQVDLALLPINGSRAERRVAGNLFGDEAAELAQAIGAALAVPCHYDMFEFNTESPELFCATCQRLDQPCRVLRCGERLHLDPRSSGR